MLRRAIIPVAMQTQLKQPAGEHRYYHSEAVATGINLARTSLTVTSSLCNSRYVTIMLASRSCPKRASFSDS
jgi:hypothetical protein